jgi:hypothetical protein
MLQQKPSQTQGLTEQYRVQDPQPPNCLGLYTHLHATRHLPPCTISEPAQRKDFMILIIIFYTHEGSSIPIAE